MSNPLTASPTTFTTPDAVGAKASAAIAAAAPPTPPPSRPAPAPTPQPKPAPANKPAPIDNAQLKPTAEPVDDDDAFDALIGHKAPAKSGDIKPEDKPAEDVHIEDTPASDEPGAENPFAPVDPAKPAEPQKTTTPVDEPLGHRTRDYSKFHPDDAAILRKLPNELYAKFSVELPRLRAQAERAKELEAKVAEAEAGPKYLHEHPEAVILTKEYRESVNDLQQTEFEAQHYREQLLKIRRGEPWKVIEAWDANGRPVYGPDRPAPEGSQIDLQADIQVNAAYQRLLADADSLKTKISSLVSSHSARAQKVIEEVRATNKRIFPDIDLDKLEGVEKETADIIRKNIHPAFVDHPQSEALVYAGVHVTRLRKMLLETREKLAKAEAALGAKQLAPAAAPTVGAAGKIAAAPGKELINTKELFGED